ncbi:MAG: alpha/beta fold hydrolase [Gemmataceae bacterium]
MPPFEPLPLLRNPHIQTVLGHLWNRARPGLPAVTSFVSLPDGDALAVHETRPVGWAPGGPQAVLVHGLGGCHQSGYMIRVTNRLAERGWRVVRVDMRGAGAGAGRASRLYNAAGSGDIRCVVDHVRAEAPDSPTALVGFSLGGNVVLKLAGETGGRGLRAIVAVAPPVDLERCSGLIERQPLYNGFFVRHLVAQVRAQEQARRLPAFPFPRRLSLFLFDDLYTAPRGGFAGATDYYRKASSAPLLSGIETPTLILAARDDPFVCGRTLARLPPHSFMETHMEAHGGHLGFLGRDGAGGVRWAERYIVEWLMRGISRGRLFSGPCVG